MPCGPHGASKVKFAPALPKSDQTHGVFLRLLVPLKHQNRPDMLFRLSRVSFWLAASVAALALLAPNGRETLLTAVAIAASGIAFLLWRAAMTQARSASPRVSLPQAPVLADADLLEAGAMLVQRANEAPSFEAALHAVADVLRSELGAREVGVHEIHGADETHARVSELIEVQPGFKTVERRVRLDSGPLGRAVQGGCRSGEAPGTVALPVLGDDRVVAVIELKGIDVPVEPSAFAALLELAVSTLSPLRRTVDAESAPAISVEQVTAVTAPSQYLQAKVLVVEDNADKPEAATRMVRRAGCRVTVASGMQEGLQALRKTQFDLVLIDMQPPAAIGAAGLDDLRERAGRFDFVLTSDTPVIALVHPELAQAGERIRELGFDDHLCRPFDQCEMLTMLTKHLRPQAPADTDTDGGAGSARAAAADTSAKAALDPAALARLTELDPKGQNKLVQRVLQAFQTSVARLRPQAETARREHNLGIIRLVAHTLKSSSASLGAMHLSQLCAQIESAIRVWAEDHPMPAGSDPQVVSAPTPEFMARIEAQLDEMSGALDVALASIEQLLKERA
jgi:CheY-like chemotaxis protein